MPADVTSGRVFLSGYLFQQLHIFCLVVLLVVFRKHVLENIHISALYHYLGCRIESRPEYWYNTKTNEINEVHSIQIQNPNFLAKLVIF